MSFAKLIVAIIVVSTFMVVLFLERHPRSKLVETRETLSQATPVEETTGPPDVLIPVRINIPYKYGTNHSEFRSKCPQTSFSRVDEISLIRGVQEKYGKDVYDYIHVLWSSVHPQKKEQCRNLTPGNIVVNNSVFRSSFNSGMTMMPPMMTYGPTYVRYRVPANTKSAILEFGNREKLRYNVDFAKKTVTAADSETGKIAPPRQYSMQYLGETTYDIKYHRFFPNMVEYNTRFSSGGCYRFSAYRINGITVKRFTPTSDFHLNKRIIGYFDEVLVRGKFTKEQKAVGKCGSLHVSNYWNWARLLASDGTPLLGAKTHSALTSLEYDEDRRFILPAGRYNTVALLLGSPEHPVANVRFDLLNGKILP